MGVCIHCVGVYFNFVTEIAGLTKGAQTWGWGRGTNIYSTVINASSSSRPRIKVNGTMDFDNHSEEIGFMFRSDQFINHCSLSK